jgi:hypothetical protein
MNMSLTEVTVAFKRALEGLGFSLGDYEDAARMIVWSEAHGLGGLQMAQSALPHLAPGTGPIKLFEHSDARAVIDADGGSVLFCGGQAVDLAYANAQQVNLSVVVLDDCRNRKLVMERLGNCGRRGMNCLAYWRDEGASPIEHVVSVTAGESLPDYRHYRVERRDGVDTRPLYIGCSNNAELVAAHGSRYLPEIVGGEVRVSAAQLALSYNASLDQGLAVNEVLRASLNSLIQKILVESTDLTVLGAE